MRKMAYSDLMLFFDIGQEWAVVVDAERENAVLIRCCKCCAKDSAVLSMRLGLEVQTMPRRQHAELELNVIVGRCLEWHPLVKLILRQFNIEGL